MVEIVQIISTVGFPITMCGGMAYFVKYITDEHRKEVSTLNEQHSEEIKKISEAINNNTLALQHLSDTLGK